jgi:ATP-dependent protease HslVU (ClpYQ) peptidase subunit
MMTIPTEIYDAVEDHLGFFGTDDFEDLFPEGWEDDEDFDADDILERAQDAAREEMADRIYCDLEAMCEDWIMQHENQFLDCMNEMVENEL